MLFIKAKASHKYFKRIKKGGKYRYFYTKKDYEKYLKIKSKKEILKKKKLVIKKKKTIKKTVKKVAVKRAKKYYNEKPSDIKNIGEDVWGAKRHNFDTYSLGELEKQGVAKKYINKKNLIGEIEVNKAGRKKRGEDIHKIYAVYTIKKLLKNSPPDSEKARSIYYNFVKKLETLDSQTKTGDEFLKGLKTFLELTRITDYKDEKYTSTKELKNILGRAYDIFNYGGGASTRKLKGLLNTGITSIPRTKIKYSKTFKPDNSLPIMERIKQIRENSISIQLSDKDIEKEYEDIILTELGERGEKKERKTGTKKLPPKIFLKGKVSRKGGKKITGSIKKIQKQLTKDLGFRALQYGNSMTDEEREYHTKKSLEAYNDLAETLNIPVNKITMNGRLAMAFGARGTAGALAHYEPSNKIINLTRFNGFGSLAHEWGHFFDNILCNIDNNLEKDGWSGNHCSTGDFNRSSNFKTYSSIEKIPADVTLEIHGAKYRFDKKRIGLYKFEKINNKGELTGKYVGFLERSIPHLKHYSADRPATKISEISDYLYSQMNENLKKYPPYWSRKSELFARGFETYIADKLSKSKRENTYLSAIKKVGSSDVYPSGDVRKKSNKMFDELFKMVSKSDVLEKAINRFKE